MLIIDNAIEEMSGLIYDPSFEQCVIFPKIAVMLTSNHSFIISAHNVIVAPADLDSPGEMGRPVNMPANMSAETKKLVDEGWLNNAFNQYASDLISVHRSLPDPRDEW